MRNAVSPASSIFTHRILCRTIGLDVVAFDVDAIFGCFISASAWRIEAGEHIPGVGAHFESAVRNLPVGV
jgi:hypothetical protein